MDSLREKEGYILNLLTEIYIFVMVILDFINYKKIKDSNSIISE